MHPRVISATARAAEVTSARASMSSLPKSKFWERYLRILALTLAGRRLKMDRRNLCLFSCTSSPRAAELLTLRSCEYLGAPLPTSLARLVAGRPTLRGWLGCRDTYELSALVTPWTCRLTSSAHQTNSPQRLLDPGPTRWSQTRNHHPTRRP